MLYLFGSRRLFVQASRTPSPTICFLISQINKNFTCIQTPYIKFCSTSTDESSSFTVSYLTNTCGLSHKDAIQSAKKLKLTTPDNPDSVLNLLQTHGLTKTQIRDLVVRYPPVLLANPLKTIAPKFLFLKELGFSGDEIADLHKSLSICRHFLLGASLDRRIHPCVCFIRTFLHSKEDIALALKRRIFRYCLEKEIRPKVQILEDHGVPQSSITTLLLSGSRLFGTTTDDFNRAVKEAVEMGVDPSQKMFVYAVRAMSEVSKVKREGRIEIYKSFGWSYDEICYAIRKQPTCIAISDEKLKIGLEFFMNKMNWEPARLVNNSNILAFSLQNRILPRLKIVEFLISKGILHHGVCIAYALMMNEANFIKRFVAKYVDIFPELPNMYQGMMGKCTTN